MVSARTVNVSGTAGGNSSSVRVSAASTVVVPVSGGAWGPATVSLVAGANRIRAASLSAAGASSAETSIEVIASADRRVAAESGRVQAVPLLGVSGSLVAKVTDLSGTPVSGTSVTFRITEEPHTNDAQLSGGGKSRSVTTDASGLASVQVQAGSDWQQSPGSGILQAVVVEASTERQSGASAVFSIQPFPGGNLTPNPTAQPIAFLFPIGGLDCASPPPLGECSVGSVDTEVREAFAVLALDAGFRAVQPGTMVEFALYGGSPGCFGGGPGCAGGSAVASASVGANGIATSPPFRLGTTVGIPSPGGPTFSVRLNGADASTTRVRKHQVRAQTPGGAILASSHQAAFAQAGPPAVLVDVSEGTTGGSVGIPASDALEVRVEDAFANPISNASITFSGLPGVAPDPGAKVFRATPAFSTASECGFELAFTGDTCAVTTVSATTFEAGTAWRR